MRRSLITLSLTGALLMLGAAPISSSTNGGIVQGVGFAGEVTIDTGTLFDGTEIGGLSGLAHVGGDTYLALSDDRSQLGDSRWYEVSLDASDGSLDDGDVVFTGVTTLIAPGGAPFAEFALDPEGIAIGRGGFVFVTSEGDALAGIGPSLMRFTPDGRQFGELPVANYYDPVADAGIRFNLAFESLTVTPDNRTMFTATEGALAQDGPAADVDTTSLARIVEYDMVSRAAVAEYVYVVDEVAEEPDPADAFRVNGLVELLWLGDGYMLALERSFSVGKGNVVKLYEISLHDATNVIGDEDLYDENTGMADDVVAVSKRLLVDFGDFSDLSTIDNLEALAFGPYLGEGTRILYVASDNNFNPAQTNQFVALTLSIGD